MVTWCNQISHCRVIYERVPEERIIYCLFPGFKTLFDTRFKHLAMRLFIIPFVFYETMYHLDTDNQY